MAGKKERRSSIKTKLLAGFLAAAFITAAIGGIGIWVSTRSQAQVEGDLALAAEMKDHSRLMQINMLDMRRAAKDYQLSFDWKYVQDFQQSVALARVSAAWLRANEHHEEDVEAIAVLFTILDGYEEAFLDVARTIRDRGNGSSGVMGELREKVDEIGVVMQEYQAVGFQKDQLMIRLSDANYVQKITSYATAFLGRVGGSSIPRSVVTRIETLMDEYVILFNRVVSLETEIAAKFVTFRQQIAAMQPLLEERVSEGDAHWENTMTAYSKFLATTMIIVIVLVVAAVVVSVMLGLVLAGRLSKPLVASVAVAKAIAAGDLTVEIAEVRSRDEVGQLVGSFKQMTASLNDTLSHVGEAVDQINTGSEQVAQASQSLSQGSTEQASSLEEVTASLNEINSQSSQNSEAASEASSVAKGSLQSAASGSEQMKSLVLAMEKINGSSDEISKVVKVIDDIAFQINLLALNANVEAARAGKYGKGFAVVADEVRNLAVRSAEAAKETTVMVNETTRNVEAGNKAAESTATQLEEIVSSSTKVADFLEEIALASKEQAQGIEQINQGLSQIDQVTQSNTANAEESAAAAQELAAQAQQLRGLVVLFKLAKRRSVSQAPQAVDPAATDGASNGNGRKAIESIETSAPSREPVAAGLRVENRTPNPKDVIKLDDDDFGKF